MRLRLMDVWKLGSSRVLVVRSPTDFNKFCRVSMGTGEQAPEQTAEEIYNHLVLGKNRFMAKYTYETNLAREFESRFSDFGPFAPLVVFVGDDP